MLGVFCRIKAKVAQICIQSTDALIIMRVYHPRPARYTCCVSSFSHEGRADFVNYYYADGLCAPSSNPSRRRFPLLSALFSEKNTVFGTIPRTTVLRNLTEAMRYVVKPVQPSCEDWRNLACVFWISAVFSIF